MELHYTMSRLRLASMASARKGSNLTGLDAVATMELVLKTMRTNAPQRLRVQTDLHITSRRSMIKDP